MIHRTLSRLSNSLSLWLFSFMHSYIHWHTQTFTQSERFIDWMLVLTPRIRKIPRSSFNPQFLFFFFFEWVNMFRMTVLSLPLTVFFETECIVIEKKKKQKHLKWNHFLESNDWASTTEQSTQAGWLCGDKVPQKDTALSAWRWQHHAEKAVGPSLIIKCKSTAPECV